MSNESPLRSALALAWRREGPGRLRGRYPADWMQGRSAFGGLQCALLVQAMEDVVGDPGRRIRTLTVQFCAPAAGDAEVSARVERAGKNVSSVSGRIVGDAVQTTALGTFAAARPDAMGHIVDQMPEVPPAEAVPPMEDTAHIPTFAQHYEFRPCLGGVPFGGGEEARAGCWVRPRGGFDGSAAELAALADACWPAVLSLFDQPRFASTVDLTLHFLAPPRGAPDAFCLVDTYAPSYGDGYAEQLGTLWDASGRLLLRSRQWVAYF